MTRGGKKINVSFISLQTENENLKRHEQQRLSGHASLTAVHGFFQRIFSCTKNGTIGRDVVEWREERISNKGEGRRRRREREREKKRFVGCSELFSSFVVSFLITSYPVRLDTCNCTKIIIIYEIHASRRRIRIKRDALFVFI